MKNITQTREALAEQRRRVQICYAVHILIYTAALIALLLGHRTPAAAVAAVNLALYFLVVRRQAIGYSGAVSQASVLYGLCAPLEGAEYTGRQGLDAARFQALELLPIREHSDSLLVREGFAGKGFGLELKGWEVSLHYPVNTGSRTDYKFLSGSILTAEGPAAPDKAGDWLLIRRGMVNGAAQQAFVERAGFQPCACPVQRLSESFEAYSRSGEALPQRWAERLGKCLQQAACLGAVRIGPSCAAVYLNGRFYTARTKVRELPEAGQLAQNPLSERDGVWELFRFWSTAGQE